MSGKRAKRVRKTVRRMLRHDAAELFNMLCDEPIKSRLKIAWAIVRKRKYTG